jgi:uncharacterized phage protein (TIGR01671 family)
MREIGFRAWDKELKMMHYNAEQAYNGHWQMNRIMYFGKLIGNPDYELMQFTGIKDEDGRWIYEGDILLWTGFDCITGEVLNTKGLVMFDRGAFYVNDGIANTLLHTWTDSKVIGNVYEQPELWGRDGI